MEWMELRCARCLTDAVMQRDRPKQWRSVASFLACPQAEKRSPECTQCHEHAGRKLKHELGELIPVTVFFFGTFQLLCHQALWFGPWLRAGHRHVLSR